MKFYYSGALDYMFSQTNPQYSLGGYLSSTAVLLDMPESIFSDLTDYGIELGLFDVRCLYLKNTLNCKVNNIKLSVLSNQTPFCNYSLGFSKPNNTDKVYVQKLTNSYDFPSGVDFYELESKRASALIKFFNLPSYQEKMFFTIEGKRYKVAPIQQINPTLNDAVLAVFNSLKNNKDILIKPNRLNENSDGFDSFYIEYRKIKNIQTEVGFTSDGYASIEFAKFSGGYEDMIELGEEIILDNDECLAIWIKRNIVRMDGPTPKELYEAHLEGRNAYNEMTDLVVEWSEYEVKYN